MELRVGSVVLDDYGQVGIVAMIEGEAVYVSWSPMAAIYEGSMPLQVLS